MRDFGSIPTSIWTDPAFASLTSEAKLLSLYLISGPHTTMIGCFRLPLSYVSEDLNFGAATVRELFEELFRNGFVVRDDLSKWVFIPTFLIWNKIENENQTKAAVKLFEQVPTEVPLTGLAFQAFSAVAYPFEGEKNGGWRNRFETLSERFRNQKQKQKQKQDQEQSLPGQELQSGEIVTLPRADTSVGAHTRGEAGDRHGDRDKVAHGDRDKVAHGDRDKVAHGDRASAARKAAR